MVYVESCLAGTYQSRVSCNVVENIFPGFHPKVSRKYLEETTQRFGQTSFALSTVSEGMVARHVGIPSTRREMPRKMGCGTATIKPRVFMTFAEELMSCRSVIGSVEATKKYRCERCDQSLPLSSTANIAATRSVTSI